MTFLRPAVAVTLLLAAASCARGPVAPETHVNYGADLLPRRVHVASGGDRWGQVRRLQFTFNVADAGKVVLSASHDWDVAAGTDTVSWTANGTPKTVTVRTDRSPAEGAPADEKAAFQRWTNDSYWLLAPTKLFDGGVNRAQGPDVTLDGTTYHTLDLSFGAVGLTAGDRYRLYVDPATGLVRRWDYMPTPDKKLAFTWDAYQKAGPLNLSTDHRLLGGDRRIYFTNLAVQAR